MQFGDLQMTNYQNNNYNFIQLEMLMGLLGKKATKTSQTKNETDDEQIYEDLGGDQEQKKKKQKMQDKCENCLKRIDEQQIIQNHKNQCIAYKTKIEEQQQQIAKFQNNGSNLQQISKLKQKINQLNIKYNNCKQKTIEKQEEIERHKSQCNNHKKKISELQNITKNQQNNSADYADYRRKIQQHEEKIKNHQNQCSKYQKQIKEQQDKIKTQQINCGNHMKQIKEQQDKMKTQQNKCFDYRQQIKEQQLVIKNQSNKCSNYQKKIKDQQDNIKILTNQCQNNQKQITEQQKTILKKEKQLIELSLSKQMFGQQMERKLAKAQQQLQQLKEQKKKLQQQKKKLSQQLFNQQNITTQSQQKIQSLKQQLKQKQSQTSSQCSLKQKKLKQIQNDYKYLQSMCSQKKRIYNQLIDKISNKQRQFKNINQKLSQLKSNSNKQPINSQQLDAQNIKIIQKYSTTLQALKTQLQTTNQSIKTKLQQLKNLQQTMVKQKLKYGLYPNRLFIGDIIQNQQDRLFIINNIQSLSNKKINKTKLLYTFPKMKMLNPHIHIDNVHHYVIIIQMENCDKFGNNYLIALYSQKPLDPQNAQLNIGKGFVSSVTNKKIYYMVSNDKTARLTQYSDYYIVFGKGEIQFKIGSENLEFNIGHRFKSLSVENFKNALIFSGDCNQSSKMNKYQAYQIIFQDNEKSSTANE